MSPLDPTKAASYERDGFLVLPGFLGPADCQVLRERAATLCAAYFQERRDRPVVFSTTDARHASEAYFLESGDKIRCFLEAEALAADGSLRVAQEHAVNKIGHALHRLDPIFAPFSQRPVLAELVRAAGLAEPVLLQSMYIFKNPHIGGEVTCHQDATYLYTDPVSVTGLWFALEDAHRDNGCLWAIPGGHRGPLRSRFRRVPGEGGADRGATEVYDATPWPLEQLVPLEVPAGTLVMLHGLLPHRSEANRSGRSRAAYALHYIDGRCDYPADNWLRPGSPSGPA